MALKIKAEQHFKTLGTTLSQQHSFTSH